MPVYSSGPEIRKRLTQCLKVLLFDSLIVIFVPPLVTEAAIVGRAIVEGAVGTAKPVVSCFLGRRGVPEGLRSLKKGQIPSYAFPEAAVRVLSGATRYGEWRNRPLGEEREFPEADPEQARGVITHAWERLGREGGWLLPAEVETLLTAYGIRFPQSRTPATTPFIIRRGCRTPFGISSSFISGSPKQNISVLAIGLAPIPVPIGSRITPPIPVAAPP